MKSNLIIMVISAVTWVTSLWFLANGLSGASGHTRYYVWAVFMISGILILVTSMRQLLRFLRPPASSPKHERQASAGDRQHFRLSFDGDTGTFFVQKSDADPPAVIFTCPVKNVSETGLGLACRGVFELGETVRGEILFSSGRTAPINGVVVRVDEELTGLLLHCSIEPTLLMAEQRAQILSEKGDDGRPPGRTSTVEVSSGSLPSHRPKGICRLK